MVTVMKLAGMLMMLAVMLAMMVMGMGMVMKMKMKKMGVRHGRVRGCNCSHVSRSVGSPCHPTNFRRRRRLVLVAAGGLEVLARISDVFVHERKRGRGACLSASIFPCLGLAGFPPLICAWLICAWLICA